MATKQESQQVHPLPVIGSKYTIMIERASWGLNCRTSTDKSVGGNYVQSNNNDTEIKENNVLYRVSQLCNGKSKCDILIDPAVLGNDPFPNCGYKALQVEYRCFSIDRLRNSTVSGGILTIDCDKEFSTQ